LQTWNSENPVIKYATKLDLKTYYNVALSERQELNYPPFSWIVRVVISGKDKGKTEHDAKRLRRQLPARIKGAEILGPAPCYREWSRGKHRTQIVIKSAKTTDPNGRSLHRIIRKMVDKNIQHGISVVIDVDPTSLL